MGTEVPPAHAPVSMFAGGGLRYLFAAGGLWYLFAGGRLRHLFAGGGLRYLFATHSSPPVCSSVAYWSSPRIQLFEAVGSLPDSLACVLYCCTFTMHCLQVCS